MAAGDLITDDLQIEFNDLLMGDDASGLEIVQFTPFDYPDLRSSDIARPLDHGLFPGTDYFGGRTITLRLETWGGWDAVRRALAAFQVGAELPLVWQQDGIGKLMANVRVRRRGPLQIDSAYAVAGMSGCAVEFAATDPRIYSNEIHSATATLEAAASGMTFNATFNLLFGVGTSSTASVENIGTFETRPLIRITGAVDAPSLINETTGKTLALSGSLAAGEYVDVDFLNRTVMLNGESSRYNWVVDSAGWWTLEPGINSIRLSGSPGSPTPTADIQWRDAYV